MKQGRAGRHKSGTNPQRLKLELTESKLVDDGEDIISRMNAIKRWALDQL